MPQCILLNTGKLIAKRICFICLTHANYGLGVFVILASLN